MITQHLKLFESLNQNKVEYLLIGGMLAISYGVPRVTKDIDLFIKATPENARRFLDALKSLNFGSAYLTNENDVCATEITIFKDYMRVDALTKVLGIDFDQCWSNKMDLNMDEVVIHCLSLDDLIKSKTASGRKRDLEDIQILEKVRAKKV